MEKCLFHHLFFDNSTKNTYLCHRKPLCTTWILFRKRMTYDKIEIAKSISNIWQIMTEQQRAMFLEHLEIEHRTEAEVIFHEGDTATHTFFVYKGRVKNEMLGLDNKQHLINMVPAGQIFASQPPFDRSTYRFTAIATEDTIIAKVPNDIVYQLVESNSEIALTYIRAFSERIDTLIRRIQNLQRKHIRGKMADMLLFLRDKCGYEADGKTLNAHPSRKEIANAAYMDISNAIRTLSAFANEGVIALDGRRYTILDEKKLMWISQKE